MSCPWSQWKQQYLFLGLLFRSPFSLSSHIGVGSSLICMRTWSSEAFNGVKLAILPRGGLDLLSSFLSLVRAKFLPLSERGSSCFSIFFGLPLCAIMLSSTLIYFVAQYNVSAIIFGVILVDGKKKFLGLESIGESCDQDFVVDFVNQKGLFIDPS